MMDNRGTVTLTAAISALIMCFAARFADADTTKSIVLQPGAEGTDVWITSVFDYGDDYGVDDDKLQVGGWNDLYYGLLQFDISRLPRVALSAEVHLYAYPRGDSSTSVPMTLYRLIEPWDEGVGWYTPRPDGVFLGDLPAPAMNDWLVIDITDLYNGWKSGDIPNYGIELRPTANNNRFNVFRSSDYFDDASLRPKLVVNEPQIALGFPLAQGSALTRPMSSFMDHTPPFNGHDGVVASFDGSQGRVESGCKYYESKAFGGCDESDYTSHDVTGFRQEGGAPFLAILNYDGGFGGEYGFYDGHTGYDYPAQNCVAEILAAADGIVSSVEDTGDPVNNEIVIDHDGCWQTFYLHHTSVRVAPGKQVVRGEVLGTVGLDHLHFTVKCADVRIDPYGWIGEGQDPLGYESPYLWDVPLGSLFTDGFESGDTLEWSIPAGLSSITHHHSCVMPARENFGCSSPEPISNFMPDEDVFGLPWYSPGAAVASESISRMDLSNGSTSFIGGGTCCSDDAVAEGVFDFSAFSNVELRLAGPEGTWEYAYLYHSSADEASATQISALGSCELFGPFISIPSSATTFVRLYSFDDQNAQSSRVEWRADGIPTQILRMPLSPSGSRGPASWGWLSNSPAKPPINEKPSDEAVRPAKGMIPAGK